jgi:hypothetical protein
LMKAVAVSGGKLVSCAGSVCLSVPVIHMSQCATMSFVKALSKWVASRRMALLLLPHKSLFFKY